MQWPLGSQLQLAQGLLEHATLASRFSATKLNRMQNLKLKSAMPMSRRSAISAPLFLASLVAIRPSLANEQTEDADAEAQRRRRELLSRSKNLARDEYEKAVSKSYKQSNLNPCDGGDCGN